MPGTRKSKPGSNASFKAAEKELKKLYNSGQISEKKFFNMREKIAKKYGAWPMGGTR